MTPTGNESAQVDALREKSCRLSNLVLSSDFSQIETLMAYRMMWYPAVTYSIGMTAMTKSQLRSIQVGATQAFLAKMGINRNFPRAVTYGPWEYGGLAFPDLSIEQGIGQIRTVMEHLYHNTEPGKLIKIAIQSLQVEAGTHARLLQNPTISLSYLTPCWLISMRTFMSQYQISLQMADNWNFNLSRERDDFLMDIFRCSGFFNTQDLKNLNAVRIFLQVATIADVATADGVYIKPEFYQGCKCSSRTSRWIWPRQPMVVQSQQDLWKKALRSTLLTTQSDHHRQAFPDTRLKTPLGAWIEEPNQIWDSYYDTSSKCLITGLQVSSGYMHDAIYTASRTRSTKKRFSHDG
jgi:hypothetical protein